jgi:accessory gene regulator protein AgrB
MYLLFVVQMVLINLWKLYNLFTESIKTSYIDSLLEREAAFEFIQYLAKSLKTESQIGSSMSSITKQK